MADVAGFSHGFVVLPAPTADHPGPVLVDPWKVSTVMSLLSGLTQVTLEGGGRVLTSLPASDVVAAVQKGRKGTRGRG